METDATPESALNKPPTVPERKRIPVNTAEPPEEVTRVLEAQNLAPTAIEGWLAVPAINPPLDRMAFKEIQAQGTVDAYELLRPFLGNRVLDGTLRTFDVLNGCGHHCDTCLVDSALPSRMFSFESLKRLFDDERFITMLQPDSIRFGSSGDLLDHPQGVEIIETALSATQPLDDRLKAQGGKERYQIKVFTNYRPKTEAQLERLIELARRYPERIRLTISLPFNRSDAVNKKFNDFVSKMSDVFGDRYEIGEDGLLDVGLGSTTMRNVDIQDVRHPRLLFMVGRVLSKEANANRVPEWDMVEGDRETSFADRGLVKTYLNPDALWLMVYTTPYESHTGRAFTPITPDNLDAISHIPYHPDFPTPPNWPGSKGREKPWNVARRLKAEAETKGLSMKQTTIVS